MLSSYLSRYQSYLTQSSALPGLDWLRAFACLWVVCYHYFTQINPLFSPFALGWMGVDLFFVLSGFLIGSILFKAFDGADTTKPAFSYRQFVWHRFLRIYPLFLFIFFAGALLKGSSLLTAALWRDFAIHATMMQTLYPLFGLTMDDSLHGVQGSWTLVLEWFFYMSAPLLVLFVRRLDRVTPLGGLGFLLFLFFSGIFVRLLFVYGVPTTNTNWFFAVSVRPPGRYDVLIAGLICAYIAYYRPLFNFQFLLAPACAILGGILYYLYTHPALLTIPDNLTLEKVIYPNLAGLMFGSFLLVFLSVKRGFGVVNLLARLSYAMYLIHFLVIYAIKPLGASFPFLPYLSIVLILSFCANLLIEYPCLTLYKKRRN